MFQVKVFNPWLNYFKSLTPTITIVNKGFSIVLGCADCIDGTFTPWHKVYSKWLGRYPNPHIS